MTLDLDIDVQEILASALVPTPLGGYWTAREVLARGDDVEAVLAAVATAAAVRVIRALGFVGNSHYCPDCMNHFHDTAGQHEPGCSVLAGLLENV